MAQGWCSCRHSFFEHPYRTRLRAGSLLALPRFFSKEHFGKSRGPLPLHGFFFGPVALIYNIPVVTTRLDDLITAE
jgi:hypothetical protein